MDSIINILSHPPCPPFLNIVMSFLFRPPIFRSGKGFNLPSPLSSTEHLFFRACFYSFILFRTASGFFPHFFFFLRCFVFSAARIAFTSLLFLQ